MTQIAESQSFTIVDPRTFEGDPFEVADRAVAQVEAVARLLGQMTGTMQLMTRNAELERQLLLDRNVDLGPIASGYSQSGQGKMIVRIEDHIASAYKSLGVLRAASSYNPRNPPKE